MSQLLTLVIVIGLVTFRVSRFIILDTLIEGWRDVFHSWLLSKPKWWRVKLEYLLGCPWCTGIWVAAGATALTDWFASVPLPVWVWLASSGISAIVWEYTDAKD